MEKTFLIFKPDCILGQHFGTVIERLTRPSFKCVALKMAQLDEAILKIHYAHVADKPFFPEIVAFMTESPVIMAVLEGNAVVQAVRDLLGPTDSKAAPKGTLRGDLGTDKMRNILHASDSVDAAHKEIALFFKREEVFSY